VSQTHSNGIITALGKSAHSQAAPLAAPTPLIRLLAKKTGMHTEAEKSAFRKIIAKKDPAVKIPKTRKTPATSKG
jgi:hypothetical protein